MLTPEQWRRVSNLFHEAIELPEESRRKLLESETGNDTRLLEEVMSLLCSHESAENFLEAPIVVPDQVTNFRNDLKPHEKIADFTVIRLLGTGSFGTVYLARQESLQREVAIKVSANLGAEARTLAHLDHDNIVKVFSEFMDDERNLRVVCMQYVPGVTLERLLSELAKHPPRVLSGAAILKVIDDLSESGTHFRPSALRDRELLENMDYLEATLWIASRMAAALSYAHARGVLHLDIKPGNIILSPYGRPCLTDFNVSLDRTKAECERKGMIGGTPKYMAPEHEALFGGITDTKEITARADIFSLGVVLVDMLTVGTPEPKQLSAIVPLEVARVVERCLQSNPEHRFESASVLSQSIEGCLELRDISKAMPPAGRFLRWCERHPLWIITLGMLVPQFIGSLINISYNSLRIVTRLTLSQTNTFEHLVFCYNLAVYPICVWLWIRILRPINMYLKKPTFVDVLSLEKLRRRALNLPLWMILLTSLGWLPGGFLFPLLIGLMGKPVAPTVFIHFVISFTLSWVIALNYSFLHTQFITLRFLYPKFWLFSGDIRRTARIELRSLGARLRIFHWLAGLVPLTAAISIVFMGPQKLDASQYDTFRTLVTLLIGIGLTGFAWALMGSHQVSQTMFAITGTESGKSRGNELS